MTASPNFQGRSHKETQAVVSSTRQWLDTVVVGLGLCPFAKPVIANDSLRIAVCHAEQQHSQLQTALMELDTLQRAEQADIATTLLVFSRGPGEFDAFLDLVDQANNLLIEAGLEGVLQIASFHPRYCFAGEPAEDVSHYTNRSPYPILHFIREDQLAAVVANYPAPETIPENNIRRLRALGRDAMIKLLALTTNSR